MQKIILTVLLLIASFSPLEAQVTQRGAFVTSPSADEEICLSSSIPISGRVTNRDAVMRNLLARFEIRNMVTGIGTFSASVTLFNVPAGASVDTAFGQYMTNPNVLAQLGSFFACIHIFALDSGGNVIPTWPFTDSACVRLFGIRTTSLPFNDPEDNYSKTEDAAIPDQTRWVSIGATVVDGDSETWDPPPPRYTREGGGVGPSNFSDPVVKMDRSDVNGKLYTGNGVGDTLVSFPFNLTGQTKAVLTFDFMRSGKHFYPDGWDVSIMTGPEQTVLNAKGEVIRPGDSLILEFKDPSEPSCNPSANGWKRIAGIDGGHDLEFQSFWIWMDDTSATIRLTDRQPQRIPLDRNYFANGFRYRLRLKANNNAANISPADDNDPWYIDHFTLMIPRRPEVEVKWVRVVTPYTKIPFSVTAALPVYLRIRSVAEGFGIPTSIKAEITDEGGNSVYLQSMPLNFIPAGGDTVIRMPDWNAQDVIKTSSKFTVTGALSSSSFDEYTQDDETFSTFYSNIETGSDNSAVQEFAYDDAGISPNAGDGNDIPFIAQITGAGIGFQNGSGSYAVKFTLPFADTIQGARVYFANGNSSPDAIRISVLDGDPNSCVPGEVAEVSGIPVTMEDVRRGGSFNQFWAYFFPKPVVLPAGVYWMSVSQLALNTMMMGGDISRGGGVITVADGAMPHIASSYSSPHGTQWSPTQNNGDVSCAFAVETPAGSMAWTPWVPPIGFWPTNFSGHSNQALTWDPTVTTPFIKAGSFMPMIRVITGSLQSVHSGVTPPSKQEFGFGEIYPNPFTPGAKAIAIHFTLIEDSPYSLVIDDEFGREVRVLAKERLEKGSHAAYWDGRDEAGAYVPPGVYFCRLQTNDRTAIVKILVIQ